MARPRRTRVFGPAYLDRVLRVDGPLVPPDVGGPLDGSVEGAWAGPPDEVLTLVDPAGGTIVVEPPGGWPGPSGRVRLARPLIAGRGAWCRRVRGTSWQDDLGGMGAGYARAFGGELIGALGPEQDATSRAVSGLLARAGVPHRPIRVPGRPADWTLLVTSGAHGDKLPIGFRGCHAALPTFGDEPRAPCDLCVVASVPNRLAASALTASRAAVRFFAPAYRNMIDRDPPLAAFAAAVDILSCNRREWEALADRDREEVARHVGVLAITDGPRGSRVRYRGEAGGWDEVRVAALPRAHPPRDTNRAGEAYAATLVTTLLDAGWSPGPLGRVLARRAAERASAAAALVLDLVDFGFPDAEAVDAALRAGRVPGGSAGDLR
jgi:sugar/nucleoside kinase (ribokinase family)